MDKPKPLVSIIVPVYNAATYIERCVYSILNQTYDNLEVILIDDGSTDQGLLKMNCLLEQDSRIHVFTQENMGVSSARNKGLDMATGHYISFVDADDWLRTDMIEVLLDILKNSDCDMAMCDYVLCRKDITEEFEKKILKSKKRNRTEYIEEVLLKGDTRCWSKLYTRELIGDIRFMKNITIGEDLLFLTDLLPRLTGTVSLSYRGYFYFNNKSGAMQQYFKPSYMDQITCWKLARDKITKIVPQTRKKITGNLLMAIMLVVGKLSLIRIQEEQKKYLNICVEEIKSESKNKEALCCLGRGYQLKIAVFKNFPMIYTQAYSQWKKRKMVMNDKIVLYAHAGSGNHGCEALVNTICKILNKPALVVTNSMEEDSRYSIENLCELHAEKKIERNFCIHTLYYVYRKLFRDPESFLRYRFKAICGKNAYDLNLSIGGDNYCYENMLCDMMLANSMLNRQGSRTVLVGCSIEPSLLKRNDVLQDMKKYEAILARESITFEALKEAGLINAFLYPDSAFLLEKRERALPTGFIVGNTIGINVSPMIINKEQKTGVVMDSYKKLIQHILDKTDMSIALIPHVVWTQNDDRIPLRELFKSFEKSGRVVMIEDGTCEELKGDIARCRMFIGARTHATIAAYSSAVPTLVVGYSVKAKGIARDLFGSYEHYVLPVQELQKSEQLIEAYEWLLQEEKTMRRHLTSIMPEYLNRAREAGKKISELTN